MHYIDTQTLEYPLTEHQIRLRHPNTSFPIPFTPPDGFRPVVAVDQPAYDSLTYKVVETTPLLVSGEWYQQWELVALSPLEQQEALAVRVMQYDKALTAHLDKVAAERRYDNRITCSLRAGYPGPYQAEGIAFAAWMDTCLYSAYELLQRIQAGTAAIPTIEEFIASLPVLQWPARG